MPSSPSDVSASSAAAVVASSSGSSTSSHASPIKHKTTTARNTKNLGLRLAVDALSAASAASLVAPLIAMIDRSIMENASGRASIGASIVSSLRSLLLRPHAVLLSKPTALIFAVYGSTYLAANTVDTTSSTLRGRPASSVTAGTTKFAASSATNIGAGIYKDQVFVRLFGPPGAVPRPVPLPSYVLFALRDCLTIFASFNVPPLLGPVLEASMSEGLRAKVSGVYAAQFLAPAAIQFVSTPIHLLGLDLYNRPSSAGDPVSARDRAGVVRQNWLVSSLARICRIVPAFGIGGVVNMKVRKSLMLKLE